MGLLEYGRHGYNYLLDTNWKLAKAGLLRLGRAEAVLMTTTMNSHGRTRLPI